MSISLSPQWDHASSDIIGRKSEVGQSSWSRVYESSPGRAKLKVSSETILCRFNEPESDFYGESNERGHGASCRRASCRGCSSPSRLFGRSRDCVKCIPTEQIASKRSDCDLGNTTHVLAEICTLVAYEVTSTRVSATMHSYTETTCMLAGWPQRKNSQQSIYLGRIVRAYMMCAPPSEHWGDFDTRKYNTQGIYVNFDVSLHINAFIWGDSNERKWMHHRAWMVMTCNAQYTWHFGGVISTNITWKFSLHKNFLWGSQQVPRRKVSFLDPINPSNENNSNAQFVVIKRLRVVDSLSVELGCCQAARLAGTKRIWKWQASGTSGSLADGFS